VRTTKTRQEGRKIQIHIFTGSGEGEKRGGLKRRRIVKVWGGMGLRKKGFFSALLAGKQGKKKNPITKKMGDVTLLVTPTKQTLTQEKKKKKKRPGEPGLRPDGVVKMNRFQWGYLLRASSPQKSPQDGREGT